MSHRLTDEAKLQYFQSLLRDEAIEYYQSLTIATEMTLSDVLTKFRKDFTKDDLENIACYKWNKTEYDLATETFSDFLKHLNVIPKQAFQGNAGQYFQTFPFRKLPIPIHQELLNSHKAYSSPEVIKAFLHRRQKYNKFSQMTLLQPLQEVTTMENEGKPKATRRYNDCLDFLCN